MKRSAWSRRLRSLFLARAPLLFARWCTLDDRELGEWGEEIAARYLRARGCRILGRRLETMFVEIDIVALERGSIVCVEVKAGRREPLPRPRGTTDATLLAELRWRPGRRCDASRIARLRRAAGWLQEEWIGSGPLMVRDVDRILANQSRGERDSRTLHASPTLGHQRHAHVDLIEVVLPLTTRRPQLVHHVDVKRPLP